MFLNVSTFKMICVTQSTGWRFPICVIFTSTWGNNPICKKGGKKNKDSYKSSKKGKSSKRDAASSTGKANLAGTTPNDEHADVQDSSATSLSFGQATTIFGIQHMVLGVTTNSGTHRKISGITT